MENSIYSNLGNRINKTFKDKREQEFLTIKDFNENKWTIVDKKELQSIFLKELKSLLKKENLFDLISSFFELETQVQIAEEKLSIDKSICQFEEFYRNLSPVLMRSLLEIAATSNSSEVVLGSIKESIRIAIEEEIYHLEDL